MEKETLPDVMEQLVGNWKFYAGGSMTDDYLVFNNDGTFTACLCDWDLDTPERKENAAEASGTWYVTAYNS